MIIIIGFIILVVILIVLIVSAIAVRSEASKAMCKKTEILPIACAGSVTSGQAIPATTEVSSLKYIVFKNQQGDVLNPYDYSLFCVNGGSMQFCGINDKDIIFVRPINSSFDDSYPKVLVLRRYSNLDKSEVQYKIRRTWKKYTYSSSENFVTFVKNELMCDDVFRSFYKKHLAYIGTEAELLEDLSENRIKKFEKEYLQLESGPIDVVISTTYHTDSKKIRFSIHPVALIEGEVEASFPNA